MSNNVSVWRYHFAPKEHTHLQIYYKKLVSYALI